VIRNDHVLLSQPLISAVISKSSDLVQSGQDSNRVGRPLSGTLTQLWKPQTDSADPDEQKTHAIASSAMGIGGVTEGLTPTAIGALLVF
jgi:hypothetical protein